MSAHLFQTLFITKSLDFWVGFCALVGFWVFWVAFGSLFLGLGGEGFDNFLAGFYFFKRWLMLSLSVLSEDDICLLQKAVFC